MATLCQIMRTYAQRFLVTEEPHGIHRSIIGHVFWG